jgi:hypothetical protein
MLIFYPFAKKHVVLPIRFQLQQVCSDNMAWSNMYFGSGEARRNRPCTLTAVVFIVEFLLQKFLKDSLARRKDSYSRCLRSSKRTAAEHNALACRFWPANMAVSDTLLEPAEV